jgi:hypothetical protein
LLSAARPTSATPARDPSETGAVREPLIGRFIDDWNQRCHPFVWTKTATKELLVTAAPVNGHRRRDTGEVAHAHGGPDNRA